MSEQQLDALIEHNIGRILSGDPDLIVVMMDHGRVAIGYPGDYWNDSTVAIFGGGTAGKIFLSAEAAHRVGWLDEEGFIRAPSKG